MNFDTLAYVASKINENNILWAIGGSLLLNSYGLVNNPNDIDILVAEKDAAKIHYVLSSIGKHIPLASKEPYLTKEFHHYIVNETEVDTMSAFAIRHSEGIYTLPFDSSSIVKYENISGEEIPYSSLEDWFVLYHLMPDRDIKANLIRDCLRSKGIENKNLLERTLEQKLPISVRDQVLTLMTLA